MFSLGGSELFIVALIALLLFGPDKIPQLARTIGRFTREFNKYKDLMGSTVRAEIYKADWKVKADEADNARGEEIYSGDLQPAEGDTGDASVDDEPAATPSATRSGAMSAD